MTSWRVQIAVWVGMVLGACSIGKPTLEATTYAVEAAAPLGTDMPAAARDPNTLRIGKVRIAAAFAGTSLIYRMDDVKFVSDPYSAFIADPGAMLGDQMVVWLANAGPFRTVAHPDSTQPAGYVLEANVTDLYGDFRPGRSPAAVLAMQLTLLDLTGARPRAVLQRSIAKRVDLPQPTPAALVRGYGVALAALLADLRGDLQGVTGGLQREGQLTPRSR